jgi:hypothetical protein
VFIGATERKGNRMQMKGNKMQMKGNKMQMKKTKEGNCNIF